MPEKTLEKEALDQFLTSASKVLVKGFLFQGLFGHDNILSSGVACGTVGVENLFSGSNISSKSGGNSSNRDSGSNGSGLGSLSEINLWCANSKLESGGRGGEEGKDGELHCYL